MGSGTSSRLDRLNFTPAAIILYPIVWKTIEHLPLTSRPWMLAACVKEDRAATVKVFQFAKIAGLHVSDLS